MAEDTHNSRIAWENALRQAFLMVGEGMPLRSVLAHLNALGVTTPIGRPVTLATLWRHLRDPAYAGLANNRRARRLSGPVVSERLFLEVQDRLSAKNRSRR